jgi:nucleoside 2-deoxyribosyltransferase
MPFRQTKFYDDIYNAMCEITKEFGYNLLRADKHIYSDDLLINILAHIHGSRFGVAVYERIADDNTNPNVAFEVGYMMGAKKPVCILKEATLKSLHTDLIGKVYVEFKLDNLHTTLRHGIQRWLQDKRIPYLTRNI